jgi:hypothetical protein
MRVTLENQLLKTCCNRITFKWCCFTHLPFSPNHGYDYGSIIPLVRCCQLFVLPHDQLRKYTCQCITYTYIVLYCALWNIFSLCQNSSKTTFNLQVLYKRWYLLSLYSVYRHNSTVLVHCRLFHGRLYVNTSSIYQWISWCLLTVTDVITI